MAIHLNTIDYPKMPRHQFTKTTHATSTVEASWFANGAVCRWHRRTWSPSGSRWSSPIRIHRGSWCRPRRISTTPRARSTCATCRRWWSWQHPRWSSSRCCCWIHTRDAAQRRIPSKFKSIHIDYYNKLWGLYTMSGNQLDSRYNFFLSGD